jgi:hypothetical protein
MTLPLRVGDGVGKIGMRPLGLKRRCLVDILGEDIDLGPNPYPFCNWLILVVSREKPEPNNVVLVEQAGSSETQQVPRLDQAPAEVWCIVTHASS